MLLAPLDVLLDHFHTFNNHALVARQDLNDLAALAALGASDYHHLVVLFYVLLGHNNQITSGASEMIFMNFLSRSSRATGPKMRVPRGLFSLSIMTMAFESKRR